MFHSNGKTTYWVNGQRFFNSKDQRNGKEKARQYCIDNMINFDQIITFDSMIECDRYEYLLDLQKKFGIRNLQHHLVIKLQDEFINANGDKIPQITYNADFTYFDLRTNRQVVEDVKGASLFNDTRFEVLKALFDKKFKDKNIYLAIILKRNDTWVEWKLGQQKKSGKLIKKQSVKIKQQQEEIKKLNKMSKLKDRLNELNAKPKLTKKEMARKIEIENILNSK